MVGGQRKGAVAIACVVALQPARILAAKGCPGQNGRFAAFGPGGRAGAAPATLSAQLRGPTMEYLEKVRSQFLSLRQQVIDIAEIIVDRAICAPFPSVRPLHLGKFSTESAN